MKFRNFITTPTEAPVSDAKSYSYYKQGVRVKFPKKAPPLRVQILPAYNPADPANSQGYVPCLMNGQPTSWFGMIQSAKFVGHGEWKSTRPILSLLSFDNSEPCPYDRLLKYCKRNDDWKYLIEKSGRFGAADFQDAVLKPIKSVLLLNIVDADDPGKGVQIAETSYSVASTLLDPETGIVYQRNLQLDNYPNADEALSLNPMLAYANGDITDPGRAPVFVIELPPVKTGQFGAGYTTRIEVSGGRVTRRTASDIELASRYHLDDPDSFLNIPTGQDIVDTLVALLKGHKNAMGVDETCAIAEAVGDMYRVQTVSSPGTVNSVPGWTPDYGSVPQAVPEPKVVSAAATAEAPVQTGFAPNPAVAAIPGEPMPKEQADLASSLAAKLRNQLNLRK